MRYRCLLFLILSLGCHHPAPPTQPPPVPVAPPYVLHIPGISGESFVDHTFRKGMVQAFTRDAANVEFEIYDWTEHDPGIPALQAYQRNHTEALKIAQLIQGRVRAEPQRTIYLTCHSGGSGLVTWALESLPADVKVEAVLYLAPALSPTYDLSKALTHVRRSADVFWSSNDTLILSAGTRTFGTIDGVYGPAAGYTGFVMPPAADKLQYGKLHQHPYQSAWLQFNNDGDHIGPMETAFAREVLAPVLRGKTP